MAHLAHGQQVDLFKTCRYFLSDLGGEMKTKNEGICIVRWIWDELYIALGIENFLPGVLLVRLVLDMYSHRR